jgi:hypothetical protein
VGRKTKQEKLFRPGWDGMSTFVTKIENLIQLPVPETKGEILGAIDESEIPGFSDA